MRTTCKCYTHINTPRHPRPVLQNGITMPSVSLCCLASLTQAFASHIRGTYKAGYQLGNSAQGFPIYLYARSGVEFATTSHRYGGIRQSCVLHRGRADDYINKMQGLQAYYPGKRATLFAAAKRCKG